MWRPRKNKVYKRKRYVGGHKSAGRNYDDPAYKQWRKDVYNRDKHMCRYPGCTCKKRVQAHHILPWSEYPALRYNIQNGITLCRKHHDLIWGREKDFIKIFHDILLRKIKNGSKDN